MPDHLSKEQRKWNMSRIRSTDTKPEFIVRSLLHRAGYRFSLKRNDLIGKPDIILPKYKTVIFVHGCFWHRHPGCARASTPESNREKWLDKFDRNIKRDIFVKSKLEEQGWQVVTVWECEVIKTPNKVLDQIIKLIDAKAANPAHYVDRREILKIADKKFKQKFKDSDK